jgi:hypothetical protein
MKSYAIYVWYDAIFNCISSSSCLALYRGSGIDVSGFQNAEIEMTRLISMKCCFFSSVDLIFRVAIVTPFPDFNKSGGRCIEFEIPRDIYWIDIH